MGKRVLLRIAYDGTAYCGWQIQINGITVEEIINRELSNLLGEEIAVIGASRTDSGVHALANVAVFDIGFHKTIEPRVYRYGIPKRYYDDYKIRRYGAHGTSHYFVTQECAKLLNKDVEDINIVTCHLGSGARITAVKNGKSFDTSM